MKAFSSIFPKTGSWCSAIRPLLTIRFREIRFCPTAQVMAWIKKKMRSFRLAAARRYRSVKSRYAILIRTIRVSIWMRMLQGRVHSGPSGTIIPENMRNRPKANAKQDCVVTRLLAHQKPFEVAVFARVSSQVIRWKYSTCQKARQVANWS